LVSEIPETECGTGRDAVGQSSWFVDMAMAGLITVDNGNASR
jgi:hypothetical protein